MEAVAASVENPDDEKGLVTLDGVVKEVDGKNELLLAGEVC